jgi:hypothetical protein
LQILDGLPNAGALFFVCGAQLKQHASALLFVLQVKTLKDIVHSYKCFL